MRANQFVDAEGNPKADAPPASNQFIAGTRKKHDDATKAKIRATFAAEKLEAYVKGEEELKDMVRALITSHPELIREFQAGPQALDTTQQQHTDATKAA